MTQSQSSHIRIDNKLFAIDSLPQEAKDVLLTINENQQMLVLSEAQHRQLSLAKATLTTALADLIKDIEPIEETNDSDEQQHE